MVHMASSCISSCMKDVAIHLPILKPVEPGDSGRFASFEERCSVGRRHPKLVDTTVSCRQLYLRSYTFSRKESFSDKTKHCVVKVAERVKNGSADFRNRKIFFGFGMTKKKNMRRRRKRPMRAIVCLRKASTLTFSAVMKVVKRLIMSCTTRVDTASD
ncbi:hypothetical protein LINPERPRIM_LOCUS25336 [Linum perenne]